MATLTTVITTVPAEGSYTGTVNGHNAVVTVSRVEGVSATWAEPWRGSWTNRSETWDISRDGTIDFYGRDIVLALDLNTHRPR